MFLKIEKKREGRGEGGLGEREGEEGKNQKDYNGNCYENCYDNKHHNDRNNNGVCDICTDTTSAYSDKNDKERKELKNNKKSYNALVFDYIIIANNKTKLN